MPSHTHNFKLYGNSGGGYGFTMNDGKKNGYDYTTDPAGGNQPHNIMQPYIAVHFIMKL